MGRLFKQIFPFMLALLMMTAVCMAAGPRDGEISAQDMAIGGIAIGAAEDYVQGVYGEPADVSYDSNGAFGKTKTYRYGSSFFVTFSQAKVIDVKSTANNGLKTPQGFTVGMPLSQVENYYGGKGYAGKQDGKSFRRYQANWYLNMWYQADEKGNIESIHLYKTP